MGTDSLFRFNESIGQQIIEALRTHGPIRKGLVVAHVMTMRGNGPGQKNMSVRMHINELERRGMLKFQESSGKGRAILVSLPETAQESELQDNTDLSPANKPHISQDPICQSRTDETPHDLFRQVLTSLALRIDQIAETVATQNEAMSFLIRNLSVLWEQIAEFSQTIDARLDQQEQTGSRQHAEVLRTFSAMNNHVIEHNSPNDNTAILAALEDMKQGLNDPNGVITRLGSSHAILRELLADRDDTHNNGNSSIG